MSDDCIFCAIADGDIPGRIVHETDTTLAFLDANPLAPGHTLVVPKAHHERLNDTPPELAADVMTALREVTIAVEAAVDADASNVAFNNGEAAGQEVPHLHGHVIPRFENDGGHPIHAIAGDTPDFDDDELDAIAADVEAEL